MIDALRRRTRRRNDLEPGAAPTPVFVDRHNGGAGDDAAAPNTQRDLLSSIVGIMPRDSQLDPAPAAMDAGELSDATMAPEVSENAPEATDKMPRRFPDPDRGSNKQHKLRNEATRSSFVDAVIEGRRKEATDRNVRPTDDHSEGEQTTMSKSKSEATADSKQTTVVAEGVAQSGKLHTDRNVIVYGTFEGDLRCRKLIIGEMGAVEGDVDAEEIVIEGALRGKTTSNRISVASTGLLEGDFTCLSLEVNHGARIQSQIDCLPEEEFRQESSQGASDRRFPRIGMSGATARDSLKKHASHAFA